MKLGRCPVCHSHLHLDALVADETGRQLIAAVAKMSYRMGPVMMAYIGLFRPEKQDLSNARALNLVTETLELTTNHAVLAEALQDTVSQLQQSRINGTGKQLTNHNYLKKVLTAKLGQMNTARNEAVETTHVIDKAEEQRLFEERMALLRQANQKVSK